MLKSKIFDVLSEGAENAKTAKEIQKLLGYKNVRDVTSEIAQLRQKGAVIISNNSAECSGYYLPSDDISEIKHFVRSMYSRIREIKKAVKSAELLLKDIGGGK